MSNETTPRYRLPYPPQDDDPTSWYTVFQSMINQVDSGMFENLEGLNLVPKTLPTVQISGLGVFSHVAAAEFVSRTYFSTITVPPTSLTLVADRIIGLTIASGSPSNQSVAWELFEAMDVDGGMVALGYVTSSLTIQWFNGAILPQATPYTLFAHAGAGAGGGDMFKAVYDPNDDGIVVDSDSSWQVSDGVNTKTAAQITTHVDDVTMHRIINDAGTSLTELWSASKISSEVTVAGRTVAVTGADTTPGNLAAKIVAGSNITLTVLNPGANEQYSIASTGGGGSAPLMTGLTCNVAVVNNDPVYLDVGGVVQVADATGVAPASKVIGIATNVVGVTCDVYLGPVELSGFAGLTPGSAYYLGDPLVSKWVLEGALPAGRTMTHEIGFARSASIMVFRPTLATKYP